MIIDLVTEDPVNDEVVLYLVEEGPWMEESLQERLRSIQARIYDAIDVVVDGHLATKFPELSGRNVRIQLDCHDQPPREIEDLIARFDELISTSDEYRSEIANSDFISGLRILSRSQMGRDQGPFSETKRPVAD